MIEAYNFDQSGHSELAQTCNRSSGDPNRQETWYLLSPLGMRYLAAIAGFDGRVQRYARTRGWGKGLGVLLKHALHTQQENSVFLEFARVARRRGQSMTWLSELESRLYYEQNERRHSFLPDGRGTYIADGQRYEFAVEIDRSRSSRHKLRRKLTEYASCLVSTVLRGEGVERLHVLVITFSWERAATIREIAQAVCKEMEAADLLSLYITTYERFKASGPDAPIWLKAAGAPPSQPGTTVPKTYCFACFKPTHWDNTRRSDTFD